VLDGIAEAPHAMVGLMQGENIGKMLVKLADEAPA
jgi:NADPH-dependent curcumin reductase CurA